MSNTSHLRRSRIKQNDEYYTKAEDVRRIFNTIRPYIKNKHIIMPFDSESSEFVKYVKRNARTNNWTYEYSHGDYTKHDYSQSNTVVISNPPFSKKKEIIHFFQTNRVNFILILPALLEHSIMKARLLTKRWYIGSCRFTTENGDKSVLVTLCSNFILTDWKVRLDEDCPHTKPIELWRAGNVYWNCLQIHRVKFSFSNGVQPFIANCVEKRYEPLTFSFLEAKQEYIDEWSKYFEEEHCHRFDY